RTVAQVQIDESNLGIGREFLGHASVSGDAKRLVSKLRHNIFDFDRHEDLVFDHQDFARHICQSVSIIHHNTRPTEAGIDQLALPHKVAEWPFTLPERSVQTTFESNYP